MPDWLKHNKKLAFVSTLVLILIMGWLYFGIHVGQKVYAQAAGHKIYKSDINKLIGNHKGINQHQAATVLADKYLTEKLAKEQGIAVTDKEIDQAYGKGFAEKKTSYPYSYQSSVNQLYFYKLQAYNRGIYKGDLLVAHFSRFIPAQPLTAQDKAAFPQLGNPQAIASDKKYAQVFITDLYNQIKSGKITWEKAAQAERNDSNLGQKAYPALTHSGTFNTSNTPEPLFTPSAVLNKVRMLQPGDVSKPFVVDVSTTDRKNIESYYLVVHLTSKTGGQAINFGDYLLQSEKRLGYKVYV